MTGMRYLLTLAAALPAAVGALVTGAVGHAGTSVVPGRNGRIVVQVSEPGGNQLYPANLSLFRLGTGAFVPLTRGDDNNANPSWSPNGRLIAFDSNAKSPTALDHDLFVIRPDASGLRRLTSGPAVDEDPSWSPDGTRIAFTRSVRCCGGPTRRPITPTRPGRRAAGSP